MPTIYKPTRITETTATIIDNILTNDDNLIKSTILVTALTDHLPTILSSNIDLPCPSKTNKKVTYKRNHTNDNIANLKQRLSGVKWHEILDNNNVDDDYNTFFETFNNTVFSRKIHNNKSKHR